MLQDLVMAASLALRDALEAEIANGERQMHRENLDSDRRNLIFEFFFRFSRFESALKERGYRRWPSVRHFEYHARNASFAHHLLVISQRLTFSRYHAAFVASWYQAQNMAPRSVSAMDYVIKKLCLAMPKIARPCQTGGHKSPH